MTTNDTGKAMTLEKRTIKQLNEYADKKMDRLKDENVHWIAKIIADTFGRPIDLTMVELADAIDTHLATRVKVTDEVLHGHLAPTYGEPDEDGVGYFFTCEGLEEFIASLLAQGHGGVREGWKWVPVEPTEAMSEAGGEVKVKDSYYDYYAMGGMAATDVWKTMLAAAPGADGKGNGNG